MHQTRQQVIHIVKWCSRLHESTAFVKIGVLVQARAIFENGTLACMRAPVFQNVCSRLGESTMFNKKHVKKWSPTTNHPRESYVEVYTKGDGKYASRKEYNSRWSGTEYKVIGEDRAC